MRATLALQTITKYSAPATRCFSRDIMAFSCHRRHEEHSIRLKRHLAWSYHPCISSSPLSNRASPVSLYPVPVLLQRTCRDPLYLFLILSSLMWRSCPCCNNFKDLPFRHVSAHPLTTSQQRPSSRHSNNHDLISFTLIHGHL